MPEPLVVVGGSVAGLVTARTAADLGRPVLLLVPGGRFGGGFLDLVVGTRRLRAGARLLELTYGSEVIAADRLVPSLESYRPGPAGHVPFMGAVRDLVHDLVGDAVVRAPVPLLAVGGRRGPDVHMTTDLRDLAQLLDAPTLGRVAVEAAACEAALGPAGVLGDPMIDPWSLPFDEASVANHGPTFHDLLVAPVASKVVAGGAASIATALRRKAWLALFHPATLREAAAGEPVGYRPHRPFHVDRTGGSSAVVQALVDQVRAHPAVEVRAVGRLADVTEPGRLHFDDGVEVPADRPVAALSAAELHAAAGTRVAGGEPAPARQEVDLVWVEVAGDDVVDRPSAVLLADPDVDAYRVGPGGTGARDGREVFVVEAPAHRADADPGGDLALATAALVRGGIVDPGADVVVVHRARASAGAAPHPQADAAFASARARLAEVAPWVEPIAGAAALGADSFNEQVVAGLHAAHRAAA